MTTLIKNGTIITATDMYKADILVKNGIISEIGKEISKIASEIVDAAEKWVAQLAAHEKTGVSLPSGWKFSLQGVQGNVRDLYNSIQHHNIEISRTALAFFMNLGLGARSSGNRALGDSQTDFFFLAVQATADYLARTLTATAVKRLVDFNWQVERYPFLAVSNLRARSFDQVLTTLTQLAQARIVEPFPELAQFITRELGLPQPGKKND